MKTATIKRSCLGAMEELDSGNFGTVYRLQELIFEGFADLAYKQFSTNLDAAEIANLTDLVDFRSGLSAGNRAILDDAAAWPLCLVTDRGTVCGFLMQLIPSVFFGQQLLPSKRTVTLPVKCQWLVVDPGKADSAGIDVPRADDLPARLVLCAKLCHLLGVLHRAGIVYGDLSLNNVMFSAATPPRIMVVDCDAAQSPRSPRITQAHTPDWVPPESVAGGAAQDIETDRYKLALFILRVLSPGAHASQTVDPSRVVDVFDLQGNTMMRAGLSSDRCGRPSAKDWYAYLIGYLGALTSPPEFGSVDLDRRVASAGSMVTVRWEVAGAQRVTVRAADGHAETHRCPSGEGQCRMSVTRSGPLTLSAENRFGSAVVETGEVVVLLPPTINRVDVAPIVLPRAHIGEPELGATLQAIRPETQPAVVLPDLAPLQPMTGWPQPGPPAAPPGPVVTVTAGDGWMQVAEAVARGIRSVP